MQESFGHALGNLGSHRGGRPRASSEAQDCIEEIQHA